MGLYVVLALLLCAVFVATPLRADKVDVIVYTEPDHCAPCRRLEKALREFGKVYPRHRYRFRLRKPPAGVNLVPVLIHNGKQYKEEQLVGRDVAETLAKLERILYADVISLGIVPRGLAGLRN